MSLSLVYRFVLLPVVGFGLAIMRAQAETPRPASMNAIVAHEYGGPEILKLEKLLVPKPKENEILIRVVAAGVNPADPLIVSGKFAREFGTHLPLIPGYDAAGTVEEVGANVHHLKRGDSVYAYLLWGGGWAEFCLTNENEAVLRPKTISAVDAAAVPLAGLTAWQGLIDQAHLSAGQTVLIHGGSGGVGSFAIQIAKAKGARVIATASAANQETLRQLGADECIDYSTTRFEEKVHDVDVVFDTAGGETVARSYGVIKKDGVLVTIRGPLDLGEARRHGIRAIGLASHPNAEELSEITKLIETGKIRPLVSKVRPLAEAADAARQAETHHTRGKVVLKIGDEDEPRP